MGECPVTIRDEAVYAIECLLVVPVLSLSSLMGVDVQGSDSWTMLMEEMRKSEERKLVWALNIEKSVKMIMGCGNRLGSTLRWALRGARSESEPNAAARLHLTG
jgi:hypothetical protein